LSTAAAAPAAADVVVVSSLSRADELAPLPSPFDDSVFHTGLYAVALRAMFDSVAFAHVKLVAQPAEGPEFAVGLDPGDATQDARLTVLTAPKRLADALWDFPPIRAYQAQPDAPANAAGRAAKVDEMVWDASDFLRNAAEYGARRCETRIDAALGRRIAAAWNALLLRTTWRPRDFGSGFDYALGDHRGVFDFLAMKFDTPDGEWAGRARDPAPDTKPGLLLDIALTLRRYCDTHDAAILRELPAQVTALERRLKH
jgi:hypothetical protein